MPAYHSGDIGQSDGMGLPISRYCRYSREMIGSWPSTHRGVRCPKLDSLSRPAYVFRRWQGNVAQDESTARLKKGGLGVG